MSSCADTDGSFSCTCNRGYNGDGVVCNPNPCDASEPPENGAVGTCTDAVRHAATCQPTCNDGYQPSGKSWCDFGVLRKAECGPGRCDASEPPTNGKVGTCNFNLAHGRKCQPTCNRGYRPSGPSSCNKAVLSAAVCEPLPCDISKAPVNGGVGNCHDNVAHEAVCQPTCNQGYTVTGTSSCNLGNTTAATCPPNPCDASANPTNGNRGTCTNALPHAARCQPACDTGYTVTGPSLCSLGVLTAATCEPDPCDASRPPTNGAKGDCHAEVAHATKCQPTCNAGYTVSGTSTCHLGRLTPATCRANPCDASVPPNFGTVGSCTTELKDQKTCQPECNQGYTVTGPSSCRLGNLAKALCNPSPCFGAREEPANGARGSCTNNDMVHGARCEPTCESGFTVSGPTKCRFGRLQKAVCNGNPCDASEPPENGKRGECTHHLKHDTTCKPACNPGYEGVVGRCLKGSLTAATCTAIKCVPGARPPSNGNDGGCANFRGQMTHGQRCVPGCSSGYEVEGHTTCHLGTITKATCKPAGCAWSRLPTGAKRGNCPAKIAHGATCTPTCDSGYRTSGTAKCDRGSVTGGFRCIRTRGGRRCRWVGDPHIQGALANGRQNSDPYVPAHRMWVHKNSEQWCQWDAQNRVGGPGITLGMWISGKSMNGDVLGFEVKSYGQYNLWWNGNIVGSGSSISEKTFNAGTPAQAKVRTSGVQAWGSSPMATFYCYGRSWSNSPRGMYLDCWYDTTMTEDGSGLCWSTGVTRWNRAFQVGGNQDLLKKASCPAGCSLLGVNFTAGKEDTTDFDNFEALYFQKKQDPLEGLHTLEKSCSCWDDMKDKAGDMSTQEMQDELRADEENRCGALNAALSACAVAENDAGDNGMTDVLGACMQDFCAGGDSDHPLEQCEGLASYFEGKKSEEYVNVCKEHLKKHLKKNL
eukprot:TRINITY_DN5999_c1_g2_i1.p1 TRINITY_DN5999_c1_g2~~TRINITY_DN5999_c1_g2_i1.p1  ORF type:complete len:1024 (-),score=138.79 TRINITY_DN5999_c1_g2_i1:56-2833(-)